MANNSSEFVVNSDTGTIISKESLDAATAMVEAANKKRLESLQKQLKAAKEGTEEYLELEKKLQKEQERIAKRANDVAMRLDSEKFKQLSNSAKKRVLLAKKAAQEEQLAQREAEISRLESLEKMSKRERAYYNKLKKEQAALQKEKEKLAEDSNKYKTRLEKKADSWQSKISSRSAETINNEQSSGTSKFGAKLAAGAGNLLQMAVGDIVTDAGLLLQSTMAGLMENLEGMLLGLNNSVNTAIEDVVSHRTHVMARLQGLDGEYDYEGLVDKINDNLATSPYIKQQDFMKKLDEAVDKGIAYNVEQRTFLATVSDKIATTFDAFDANLLRLIKLQQADSTAARLGMEAALTKTLNTAFSDTSYLTDNVYDQVSAAILDSESILSRDGAAEYEYIVQKWLGSLYSTGVSNNTINQIAQGLNYIGTGNVSALAGNSPLQTLFAMSASRANGLSYADLLTGGLDAAKTNELLKSMVEYLQEIAENSGNNVVKSAWGDIYQMSLADMRAVSSLTSDDISSIYSQSMSYSDMTTELNNQFNSVSKRMSAAELMSNVIDNFVYTIGNDIAHNAVEYVMWEVTDLIQSATGGIRLPAISVMGNMIDLSAFTVEGMLQTGLVGLNVLGSIGTILGTIGKSGGLDMGIWGGQEYLTRGKVETTTNGWTSTTSGSTYVGSSSSSDMKNSSIAGATEDAEEVSDITNANNKTEHTFDEFFEEVLINGWPIHTKSVGEYNVSDLYSRMYVDRTPVPVIMDTSAGVGAAVALMARNINKVSDVNIKSADAGLSVTLMGLDSKFRDSVKAYLKTTFAETMADEIKKTVIGSSSGDTNTIAKVCKKILDDSVDVVIKNTNFDNALDRYYMNGF